MAAFRVSAGNTKKAVELQAEKLEEEEKRFARGRSSTKNLIDHQNDLRNAELRETLEMLALKKALTDLERTMNVTLEKYEEIL